MIEIEIKSYLSDPLDPRSCLCCGRTLEQRDAYAAETPRRPTPASMRLRSLATPRRRCLACFASISNGRRLAWPDMSGRACRERETRTSISTLRRPSMRCGKPLPSAPSPLLWLGLSAGRFGTGLGALWECGDERERHGEDRAAGR